MLSPKQRSKLIDALIKENRDVSIKEYLLTLAEIESVKDFYSLRVYGSNSDVFSELDKFKLYQIDWSDFDEIWEIQTMVDARIRTTGLIYPVVDYHEDSPNAFINNDNRTVNGTTIFPCVFVKDVLDRIFEYIGYSYTNEVEEDYELVMPLITKQPNDVVQAFIAEKYEGVFGITGSQIISFNGGSNTFFFHFDTVTGNTGSYYALPYTRSNGNPVLTIVDSFSVDIVFDFNFTFTGYDAANPVSNTVTFRMNVFNEFNGLVMGTFSRTFAQNPDGVVNINFTQTFTFLNFAGGTRFLDIQLNIINADSISQVSFEMENTSTVEFTNVRYLDNTLEYNTILNVSLLMPDLTFLDFVKNYMLMFGLIPVVSLAQKTIALKKFSTINSSLYLAKDWSEKVDFSEEPELRFINSEYGQNNLFKYTVDGNEIVPFGSDGNMTIDNKNLELEKTIVELDFASSNYVTRIVNNIVTQVPVCKDGIITNELSPRILYLQRKTSTDIGGSMVYSDGSTDIAFNSNIGFGYFINPLNENNLGFGNSLLNDYQLVLQELMNRLKIIVLPVRLSANDISELDFSKPVYIGHLESYFYVSAIKGFDYTESKSTFCELVKLNIHG